MTVHDLKLAPLADELALKPKQRVDAIDCGRGAALVGMALYHLAWDLADFGFVPPTLPFSPPMRLFSHLVASAFLALAGASLALAHPMKTNWKAFWRRIAVVGGAAAVVSTGSFAFAPGQFIWFGILHCIAVSSVLAAPFIQANAAATFVAGTAAIAAPFFFHSKTFDPPALLWIGLGDALPNTLDWRPLLPWGGVLLLGLSAARFPGTLERLTSPARWRPRATLTSVLCFAGRHSLPIYLVHQPLLVGLVAALAHLGLARSATTPTPTAFLAACQHACEKGRGEADACEMSCRCALDVIERSGVADRFNAGALDKVRSAEVRRLVQACIEP